MTQLEIERKFLLHRLPTDLDRTRSEDIEQGYIALTADSREVRVRRKGSTCFLAVKVGKGAVRQETEIALSESQFQALWATTSHAQLRKRRHYVDIRQQNTGLLVELDEYLDALSPLLVAEVEFSSEDQCRAFSPPSWFGAEITGNLDYSNYNLATRGLPAKTACPG